MIKRIANALISAFDLRDIVLAIGLCLMSVGISLVWVPGALIVPGAIISAVAIFANRIDGNAGEG